MKIIIDRSIIQEIPFLTIAPANNRPCPAIFFVPGYGHNKESGLGIGYRLARRGFFVISFDPWLHGERYDRRLDYGFEPDLGGLYPADSGLDIFYIFFQIIHQCLDDVRTLMRHFAHDARVDVSRCGVTGWSMGGYASFLLFANIPEMKAAVPMVGIPSFYRRWNDVIDETRFSNPEWAATMAGLTEVTQERGAFVRSIDPYDRLKDTAPRALLIMNCDFDSDQPKHHSVDAYRELLPHYADSPENLCLRVYPTGHQVTRAMERDAVKWFEQNLLEG